MGGTSFEHCSVLNTIFGTELVCVCVCATACCILIISHRFNSLTNILWLACVFITQALSQEVFSAFRALEEGLRRCVL